MELFFLMMVRNAKIQTRAQEEIDSVVGDSRPPTTADCSLLPYVNCILKELLRFNPVVALAVHGTLKEDVYNGYLIPKGKSIQSR